MYLVTSGAALLTVTVYFLESALELALLFPLVALIGWLRLWGGAAGVVLLLSCWFSYFPLGMPLRRTWDLYLNPLPEIDIVVAVLAMVVYIGCHWRYISLMREVGVATQPPDGKEVRWRRPVEIVPTNEWLHFLWHVGLAVTAAWLLGFLAHITLIFPGHDPPLSWNYEQDFPMGGALPGWLSRLILLTALGAIVVAGFRTAQWWLRYRRLNPDEAAMMLQEQAWEQLQREWRRAATFHHRYQTRAKRKDALENDTTAPSPRSFEDTWQKESSQNRR
jgi:hypothetical protein